MALVLPIWILLGLGLGLLFVIVFGRWAAGTREDVVYATGLVGAALIYLLFAFVAEDTMPLVFESVGFVVFTALALRSMRRTNPRPLLLGWLLHAGWDGLVHIGLDPGIAPPAYPPICLGFDLMVAGYLAGRLAALLPDPTDT